MKTEITQHEDLSQLSDDMLDRVIAHEREVYGYKGYGEYAFCSSRDCRRILSIDEVYGASDTKEGYKPLDELEKDGCQTPDCPDCGEGTILIFDPKIYRPYLAGLYRNAYGSLLTDESSAVRGTCVFQESGLREFFKGNMNYKDSMTWEDFRDRASAVLGIDFQEDTAITATNRVSVERPFRKGGLTFMQICRSTLNIKPENDIRPAFASVRFDGNVLPALQAIGYEQVYADEFGTVAIGVEKLGGPRAAYNLSPEEFMQQFGPRMQQIIAQHRTAKKDVAGPKYYKGAAVLDDLQEASGISS